MRKETVWDAFASKILLLVATPDYQYFHHWCDEAVGDATCATRQCASVGTSKLFHSIEEIAYWSDSNVGMLAKYPPQWNALEGEKELNAKQFHRSLTLILAWFPPWQEACLDDQWHPTGCWMSVVVFTLNSTEFAAASEQHWRGPADYYQGEVSVGALEECFHIKCLWLWAAHRVYVCIGNALASLSSTD